jgi:radical SAM protein with 4Fe4S-binding SPASM domain
MNSRSSKVPRYFMADWSITQSCDVGCLFCPLESGAWSWQACTACLRKADVDEDANVFRHTSIIVNQLASLGVKRLYIRGGNPLLAWDRLVSILDEAERYPEIIVTITTPGSGCSIEDLLTLSQRPNVRLNLVLFDAEANAATSIHRAGLWARQQQLLEELSGGGSRFFVTLLLCGATRFNRERMSSLVYERWHHKPKIAEVYTAPEAANGNPLFHSHSGGKLLSCWRTPEEFYNRATCSSCLPGRFQIHADGSINPCVALGYHCGEVTNGELGQALRQSTLYDWWSFSKNEFAPCNRCALRYACLDCAAAEVKCRLEVTNVHHFCSFNPDGRLRAYQMEWEHTRFAKVAIVGPTVKSLCQELSTSKMQSDNNLQSTAGKTVPRLIDDLPTRILCREET